MITIAGGIILAVLTMYVGIWLLGFVGTQELQGCSAPAAWEAVQKTVMARYPYAFCQRDTAGLYIVHGARPLP
jgi:hypothetical protein